MTTTSSTNDQTLVNIRGISDPTIHDYFTKLNNKQFIAVAELFSEQGTLIPPFEKNIQGKGNILEYLEKEAKGIKSYPEQGEIIQNSSLTEYQIQGTVEISQFVFNTEWFIQLNSDQKIIIMEVKLAASLESLLDFK
jgi:hypothetical protein